MIIQVDSSLITVCTVLNQQIVSILFKNQIYKISKKKILDTSTSLETNFNDLFRNPTFVKVTTPIINCNTITIRANILFIIAKTTKL